jgi:glycine cleavage system H protein
MTDVSKHITSDENWPIPEGLWYDRNNFWIKMQGQVATVGLTAYGQWVIGEILYLDVVPVGSPLLKGDRFGSVESGKWVGNLISPLDGYVRAYNPAVMRDPRGIQRDPYGEGWIMLVELAAEADSGSFLDHTAYAAFVQEQASNAA